MENYRGFKKDLLDMKSLNLCSRLPNLFEITHLQTKSKRGKKSFSECWSWLLYLIPVNAFICLCALFHTQKDRPGHNVKMEFPLIMIYNCGYSILMLWWFEGLKVLTRSFRLSRTCIGRSQKGPNHLGCSPVVNDFEFQKISSFPLQESQSSMMTTTMNFRWFCLP